MVVEVVQVPTNSTNEECMICLESLSADSTSNPFQSDGSSLVVACDNGHVFHRGCILKHRDDYYRNNCPACQASLLDNNIDEGLPSSREKRFRSSCGTVTAVYLEANGTQQFRLLRMVFDTGEVLFFEGEGYFPNARKVSTKLPDGTIAYFDGPNGQERMIRKENIPELEGFVQHFDGSQGEERLVRIDRPNGQGIFFYEGDQGEEHIVRLEWGNQTEFYEGSLGFERKVRVRLGDDATAYFEGERFCEHKVRVEYTDGVKQFYEGERRNERLVRIEWPNGRKKYFEGEAGNERVIRRVRAREDENLGGAL